MLWGTARITYPFGLKRSSTMICIDTLANHFSIVRR
jgi:hypothetical protein